MIKIIDLLNEAKQVGILYHYTRISDLISIFENGLKFSKAISRFATSKTYPYSISTTRSWNFGGGDKWGLHQSAVRITIDGDKVSEKYKLDSANEDNLWNNEWQFWKANKNSTFFRPDEVPKPSVNSKEGKLFEERILSKSPGYLDIKYFIKVEVLEELWEREGDLTQSQIKKAAQQASIDFRIVSKYQKA